MVANRLKSDKSVELKNLLKTYPWLLAFDRVGDDFVKVEFSKKLEGVKFVFV